MGDGEEANAVMSLAEDVYGPFSGQACLWPFSRTPIQQPVVCRFKTVVAQPVLQPRLSALRDLIQ